MVQEISGDGDESLISDEKRWIKEITERAVNLMKQDQKQKPLETGQQILTAEYTTSLPGREAYSPFASEWWPEVLGRAELRLQRTLSGDEMTITIRPVGISPTADYSLTIPKSAAPNFKIERVDAGIGRPSALPPRKATQTDINDFHWILCKDKYPLSLKTS